MGDAYEVMSMTGLARAETEGRHLRARIAELEAEISRVRAHAQEDSLSAARAQVLSNLDKGGTCPCCAQFAKAYKRALNAPMAVWLIWLVRAYEREPRWYDFREGPTLQARKGGGDFAKLVHWGLILMAPNDVMPNKRTSGLYRPTARGLAFVHGHVTVPSHVKLYDNKVIGWSDGQATIQDALGESFDYAELMRG
jgi:hypothetical protein